MTSSWNRFARLSLFVSSFIVTVSVLIVATVDGCGLLSPPATPDLSSDFAATCRGPFWLSSPRYALVILNALALAVMLLILPLPCRRSSPHSCSSPQPAHLSRIVYRLMLNPDCAPCTLVLFWIAEFVYVFVLLLQHPYPLFALGLVRIILSSLTWLIVLLTTPAIRIAPLEDHDRIYSVSHAAPSAWIISELTSVADSSYASPEISRSD